MKEYYKIFWNILNDLSKIDPYKWPKNIPREIDHTNWNFCFQGESIFVVCNTPSISRGKAKIQ
ncbi:MAG: YqcI/YcgG family protein [Flavobacteriales bacterium AspAUS03]